MKKTYSYSLLQYHHSIILGEIINIGLLIYFPTISKLRFLHPVDLSRLKNLYLNFPEGTVFSYYEYFQQKVGELNEMPSKLESYDISRSLKDLIDKEFLSEDSSMLQFSNHSKAVLYTDKVDTLIKSLANTYFPLDKVYINNEDLNSKTSLNRQKKADWIKPDVKNKIVKVDKDFIFLPNKNELSF